MLLLKKIKASSLQMVMVVSVIILLLLFAFISLIYIKKRISVKNSNFKESVYLMHQVFDYVNSSEISFGVTNNLDFFNNNNQSVIVSKRQWGIFELLSVTTRVNKESFKRSALVGNAVKNRDALYLSNKFQPLIVVLPTTIRGNAMLPSRGVNSGNIAGVSYNKERFVYGDIFQSESLLPKLLNKDKIKHFLTSYINDTVVYFDLERTSLLQNKFEKRTKVFQKNGEILLPNTRLKGNIIIESDSIIKIDASSKLEDVILIAPQVEIAEGFKGSIQVFATKNISIEKNCYLTYPTALVVFDNEENGKITISNSSLVKGIIGYFKKNSKKSIFKPNILLDSNAVLFGEMYSMGNVELRGTVNGSIYTNSFIANQSGGIYMNHIYNGIIDSEKLPKQYVGLNMIGRTKNVVKWID